LAAARTVAETTGRAATVAWAITRVAVGVDGGVVAGAVMAMVTAIVGSAVGSDVGETAAEVWLGVAVVVVPVRIGAGAPVHVALIRSVVVTATVGLRAADTVGVPEVLTTPPAPVWAWRRGGKGAVQEETNSAASKAIAGSRRALCASVLIMTRPPSRGRGTQSYQTCKYHNTGV